jgi:hypothetical protein
MTEVEARETLKQAQARVANTSLPLDVRIRSKETVALCEERLTRFNPEALRRARANADATAWLLINAGKRTA